MDAGRFLESIKISPIQESCLVSLRQDREGIFHLGDGETVLNQVRAGQARLQDTQVGHFLSGNLKTVKEINENDNNKSNFSPRCILEWCLSPILEEEEEEEEV